MVWAVWIGVPQAGLGLHPGAIDTGMDWCLVSCCGWLSIVWAVRTEALHILDFRNRTAPGQCSQIYEWKVGSLTTTFTTPRGNLSGFCETWSWSKTPPAPRPFVPAAEHRLDHRLPWDCGFLRGGVRELVRWELYGRRGRDSSPPAENASRGVAICAPFPFCQTNFQFIFPLDLMTRRESECSGVTRLCFGRGGRHRGAAAFG
jgi:hypothetical protein